MSERADVIVVGMGPGGEDVAGRLAEAVLDVVGVEAELPGGECPYWGCVPSKKMIRAADLLAEAGRVSGMAGEAGVRPDWAPVARRIRDEATDSWDDAVAVKRFEEKGGRLVRGWGRLDGPNRVGVGDRLIEADRAVIVNVGTRAWIPPVAGLAGTPYWTNRDAVEAEQVPGSLAVLGGDAIVVEMAQGIPALRVRGRRARGRSVPGRTGGARSRRLLAEVFASEGIGVRTAVAVESVRHDGRRFTIGVAGGPPVVSDRLLVATGRRPDLAGLNVASVGLDDSAPALPVDDHLRVPGVEGLWAVGDVTGQGQFTHLSMSQADIVVNDVLGNDVVPADYRAVPRVTFTIRRSDRSVSWRGRPVVGASRCGWEWPMSRRRPGDGSTRRGIRGSSRWWRTHAGEP